MIKEIVYHGLLQISQVSRMAFILNNICNETEKLLSDDTLRLVFIKAYLHPRNSHASMTCLFLKMETYENLIQARMPRGL